MQNVFLRSEYINNSRTRQRKRRLANLTSCRVELDEVLKNLFLGFDTVLEKTNDTLKLFKPQDRARVLEASVIQTFLASEIFERFGNKAFYGKYRRLILNINGYIILFKKLNKKGYPMNIKTQNIQNILNQQQTLELFSDADYADEPILYFGYQKNRIGDFVNPSLVYIDEGEIKFKIDKDNYNSGMNIIVPINSVNYSDEINPTSPKLRDNIKVNNKAAK